MVEQRTKVSSKQYETFAQWLERVALVFLVSFVVQNLVRGAFFTSPIVAGGVAASLMAYYGAVYLMLITYVDTDPPLSYGYYNSADDPLDGASCGKTRRG